MLWALRGISALALVACAVGELYGFQYSAWRECTLPCAGGTQHREVWCMSNRCVSAPTLCSVAATSRARCVSSARDPALTHMFHDYFVAMCWSRCVRPVRVLNRVVFRITVCIVFMQRRDFGSPVRTVERRVSVGAVLVTAADIPAVQHRRVWSVRARRR
jgi:hypothetical protein